MESQKSISTKENLGLDIGSYRKLIGYQFTPEKNWLKIEIDYVKPICMFNISKNDELRECFIWKNTQPLLKEKIINRKGENLIS